MNDPRVRDFKVGDRVEMHPATDLWMRGARFGNVVKVGRTRVHVKLDKLPRPVEVAPSDLQHVSD